jgi:hypothetical protein
MGTAHGAEELGLWNHRGLCAGTTLEAATIHDHRVMPRIWPYLDENQRWSGVQKYFARLVTLSRDEILTNDFLLLNCGTLYMRIAVSCE